MATKKKVVSKKKTTASKKKSKAGASTRKKAPSSKKTASKKTATKKRAVKKKSAKKVAKKKVVKKVAKKVSKKKKGTKKVPAKKTVAKKKVAKAKVAKKKTTTRKKRASAKDIPPEEFVIRKVKTHLSAKDLRMFKKLLLELRDRIVDEISFLAGGNLTHSANGDAVSTMKSEEQGTDNFDREFALNLVSSEQDIIYEIDEALRRIDLKTYGVCEMTGEPIEYERLKVLPYARNSVKAQSELERGRQRYRPFGSTISRA